MMTPDEARQYLAELSASGETTWVPAKPLDEYQDDQVTRKAREFQRMERAGLPIDNRVARGHAEKEKGREVRLNAPAEAYKLAREATSISRTTTKSGDERYISEFVPRDENSAERVLQFVSGAAPGTHVTVKYVGDDGSWHTIYSKGGREINSLMEAIGAFDGDIGDWLDAEADEVYGAGDGAGYTAGAAYSFVVVSR